MILQMNKIRHRTLLRERYYVGVSFPKPQNPYKSHAQSHVHLNGKYGHGTFPLSMLEYVSACWKERRFWALTGILIVGIGVAIVIVVFDSIGV
jgi:hypothetical protein